MKSVNKTGGARIGRANATWPFASLSVTGNQLTLNATILGKFVFIPSDIESIEPYRQIPLIGQGIKINHTISTYKEHIVFWTFNNPSKLIEDIKDTGFLNVDNRTDKVIREEIRIGQASGGFPLKLWFPITIVVLWNLLFFIDLNTLIQNGTVNFEFGKGLLLSGTMIILASVLLLTSASFQKMALKNNRSINDIKGFIYFILLTISLLLLTRILSGV